MTHQFYILLLVSRMKTPQMLAKLMEFQMKEREQSKYRKLSKENGQFDETLLK